MRRSPRALRALLWLYPPRHRRAYGEEMWEVVCYRTGQADTALARVRSWVGAAVDLTWNATRLWARLSRRSVMGTGRGWVVDIRFVLRSVLRSPVYAGTVVVVLAAAVAVNTSVFSFVRGTLLPEPTYPGADRVVVIWGSNAEEGQIRDVISGPNYIDLRESMTSLEALTALHVDGGQIVEEGRPTPLDVMSVSPDFFSAVPVQPLLGRTFTEEDRTSSGPNVVLVSYAFWRDRLASDPAAVGRSLPMNNGSHTIVGVLPEDFEFIFPAPVWAPLRDDVLAADFRARIHYHLVGRMRPGVTASDVSRDLTAGMGRIAEEYPEVVGWSVLAEPLHEASVLAVRSVLWTATAAVSVVLLIALVNLTTLFRIRTLGRTDELAVRLALGAGARGIVRVLALEALGLTLVGATLGLLVAPSMLAWIRDLVPLWINIPDSAARVPVLRAVYDPWVAAVAAGVAILGAMVLVVPALVAALRARSSAWGGRRASRIGGMRGLVMVELALATVLCLGAALTSRSAERMLATDVGLQDEGLLAVYFGDVWDRDIPARVAYYEQVTEAVAQLPGVASAALIDYVPFQGEDDYARIYLLDRSFQPVNDLREEWRRVSHGLFETAGMRMVRGRSFVREDFMGTVRTAVVNESFARKHYPGGDALGQFLSTHDEFYRDMEIVGIVADLRSLGPASPAPPMLYVPLQGNPRGKVGMFVRAASGPPAALTEAVRDAIWSVDPSQFMDIPVPLTDLVGAWVAIPRAVRSLLSAIAGFALLLASVGIFGVVSYVVRSRTSEMGVRLALGASPDRLKRDLLSGAVPMVLLGVGGGLVVGVLAARAAGAVLFGVAPGDPASMLGAVAAMSGAAFLATYLPARRVARIDPTDAIRSE